MSTSTNVKEIGYAFLKTYYQRMRNDPSKIHHLYSATAELTHVDYQVDLISDKPSLPTIKLIGKDNINKYYTRHSKKVTTVKVKVDSCDFQFTGSNNVSILILAVGEMCWSQTPSYRFCQTFILTPATNNPEIYDVTNDILRFIPEVTLTLHETEPNFDPKAALMESMNENEENQKEPNGVENTESSTQESLSTKNTHEKPTIEEKPSSDHPKSKMGDGELEDVQMESKQPPSMVRTTASLTDDETQKPIDNIKDIEESKESVETSEQINGTTDNDSSPAEKNRSTEQQNGPPKKMNWASKIASSESKDVPNVTTKYIRAEPQVAPSTKKLMERKSTSPTGQLRDPKNFRKKVFNLVNKDGFFPVYVRGTGGVSDEQLVRALESEFGVVKKISSQETFAVIDFEDQRCQTEAIERGILRINNVDVHMEPKTLRKSTTSSSSPSPSGQRFGRKHLNKKKN